MGSIPDVTALRELFGRLLAQEQTFRAIAEEVTDVDICYEMGQPPFNRHPLLGRWAPNLVLTRDHGRTQVADFMHGGKGILVDLAGRSSSRKIAANWADRVDFVAALCYERPAKLDAFLIRPDGYVSLGKRIG